MANHLDYTLQSNLPTSSQIEAQNVADQLRVSYGILKLNMLQLELINNVEDQDYSHKAEDVLDMIYQSIVSMEERAEEA